VERVRFWGNSLGQLRSLPPGARAAFAWAILELERNPSNPPSSEPLDVYTEPMRGAAGLYRIAVGTVRDPPGYRGIFYLHRESVYLIRFRRRDPVTYRGLRKDLARLLSELGST
jgi:hypothetical protein